MLITDVKMKNPKLVHSVLKTMPQAPRPNLITRFFRAALRGGRRAQLFNRLLRQSLAFSIYLSIDLFK